MPQDTGLPDGSESRPCAGWLSPLSLPLKKQELMERKALPAEGSPGQPGSGSALPATLCQPCLPRGQQAAAQGYMALAQLGEASGFGRDPAAAGPSYALVYSHLLCSAVTYWQRRALSRSRRLWSLLLLMASTAFVLPHFQRGSLTALPGGWQKRVEELQVEDFLGCTASAELHLSPCLVQGIRRSLRTGYLGLPRSTSVYLLVYLGVQDRQVCAKVLQEYPFFSQRQGWVSCCPHTTSQLYQLPVGRRGCLHGVEPKDMGT